MGDPVTTALAIGVSGGMSFLESDAQNKAVRRAGDTEKALNAVSAGRERTRNAVEFARLDGALRATAASRGVAGSKTAADLQNAAGTVGAANRSGINLNEANINAGIESRVQAQQQNPFVSAVLSSLQTGLTLSALGGTSETPQRFGLLNQSTPQRLRTGFVPGAPFPIPLVF